jgi:hypothetical protein
VTRDKHGSKACAARPLPAGEIERYVAEQLRLATADGLLANEIAEKMDKRIAARRRALVTEQREIPKALDRLSLQEKGHTERQGREGERRAAEVRAEMERRQARLVEVGQELVALEQAQIEAEWVTTTLSHFDAVWEAMIPQNRKRLLRAVVDEVLIDEPSGEVTVKLANIELPNARTVLVR